MASSATPVSIAPGTVFFLDTNIFVYALLASEPLKKQRALQLVEQALASHLGCTSYQVIQEFANVATRKFVQRFTAEQCKQFIDAAMQPMNRVASSPELLNGDPFGKGWLVKVKLSAPAEIDALLDAGAYGELLGG